MKMITSIPSEINRIRRKAYLTYIIPLVVYVIFIVTANLIGGKYSCEPIANIYYWEGFISIPILFSVPFIFSPKLQIVGRFLLSVLYIGIAYIIWAWSFDSAGMYFMCKLF